MSRDPLCSKVRFLGLILNSDCSLIIKTQQNTCFFWIGGRKTGGSVPSAKWRRGEFLIYASMNLKNLLQIWESWDWYLFVKQEQSSPKDSIICSFSEERNCRKWSKAIVLGGKRSRTLHGELLPTSAAHFHLCIWTLGTQSFCKRNPWSWKTYHGYQL